MTEKQKTASQSKEKKTIGRPPKFKTQEELSEALVAYFKRCIDIGEMPNKAGACVFLKISKDTYNEYRKTFPVAIKEADSIIENAWVQRLSTTAPTGAIFYLKNAFKEDYKDRTETDLTSNGKELAPDRGAEKELKKLSDAFTRFIKEEK